MIMICNYIKIYEILSVYIILSKSRKVKNINDDDIII